ncbi:MAG: cadmium-translocating P-type ATPase [Treponema sp.]|jgi:Cd2+/Zn2+-exporting ATPase|nr:cadmium-translocating P-type ATPase [Treponema sp.]
METQGKHTRIRVRDPEFREGGCSCCAHSGAQGGHGAAHGEAREGAEGERAEEQGGFPLLAIGLGALFFAAGLVVRNLAGGEGAAFPGQGGFLALGLFAAAYAAAGGKVLLGALGNIRALARTGRGSVFDENFLMAIASLGAFCIGEYPEGVAVMIFYRVGEAFQDLALRRSRSSIAGLMDLRPDYANLKRGEEVIRTDPREVHPGDLILVKPGEKIPLDGAVTEGRSALDCSALTGESLPRDVEPGSGVLSGSINKTGVLVIRVDKEFGESTAAKILELVQNAGTRKAPVENFITRFARYYTPVVAACALGLALIPPLVLGIRGAAGFAGGAVGGALGGGAASGAAETGFMAVFALFFPAWLHRALVFLVVSCPCALVISVPLSFFGGIGGASRRGILIKGGNYLEALNRVDTVVFDKTGTLTRGVFKVTKIQPSPPFSEAELLRYAAAAEHFSNHPIAQSIRQAAEERGIGEEPGESPQEIPGRGLRLNLGSKTVLAGNIRLLEENGVSCPAADAPGTVVYVSCGGVYAGHLEISDEPRADAKDAVRRLKAAGVRRILMFTGDNARTGAAAARTLGLDGFYGELLPQDKVAQLEALYAEGGGKIVFVGDGINDAPVLARSDVGVAMGMGQDAAIEAADMVLMTSEPSRLADALAIARKTHRIVWQNIGFALGVKGIILVLGALGLASMWAAVFADVGVSLLAILNAMRAQYTSPAR